MAPELTNIKGDAVADSSTGTKKVRRRLRKSNGEALESEKIADQNKPCPAKVNKEAEPSSSQGKKEHEVDKRKRNDPGKHDIDGKNVPLNQRQKENKIEDGRHEGREEKRIGNGTGIGRHEERKEKKTEDGRHERREDKKIGNGTGLHEEREEKKIKDGRHERREDKKIGNGTGWNEGRKEKKIRNGGHDGRKETSGSIAGAIFMCNSKTKPDCFHYSLMGVSSGKQGSVMRLRPGLKLFLYDFDLKIMHGIFEATSGGGMNLEPAAFGGYFPAQVRFKVLEDCLPLPEAVFKKAISYDNNTRKFKTELTVEQVRRLTELFRPNPLLHSRLEFVQAPIVHRPPPFPSEEILQQNHREEYGSKLQQGSTHVDHNGHYHPHDAGHSQHPLFLTEREYRSYGLHGERKFLPNSDPAPNPSSVAAPPTHMYENFRFDYGGEQPQNNHHSRSSNVASFQNEQGRPSLLFLSEKEYRAFGLKGGGGQELPGRRTPEDLMKGAYNPYDDSTASVVSRYLTLPGPVASTAETYYPAGAYVNASSSRQASEPGDHSLRLNPEIERLQAPYVTHAMSNENRHYHQLGGNPDPSSMSVSSRYSFGGPSLSKR